MVLIKLSLACPASVGSKNTIGSFSIEVLRLTCGSSKNSLTTVQIPHEMNFLFPMGYPPEA
jgi:hypothetical protein